MSKLQQFWDKRKPRTFYQIPEMTRYSELLGGGFVSGGSHMIFAETGRGKTSFAIDLTVKWLMKSELRICFISLEEDIDEVQSRIAARLLGMNRSYSKILAGEIDKESSNFVSETFKAWGDRLDLLNVSTSEIPSLSEITNLKSEIGKRFYDYDIFIIDHIHHVQMDGKDNQTTITGLLADHIKEMNNKGATILAIAQMRKNENAKQNTDYGQRTYESIAGSSKNMQNASSITHLYYTEKQEEGNIRLAERGQYNEMAVTIRLEKSRYGRRGGLLAVFDPRNCIFTEEPYNQQRYKDIHEPLKS